MQSVASASWSTMEKVRHPEHFSSSSGKRSRPDSTVHFSGDPGKVQQEADKIKRKFFGQFLLQQFCIGKLSTQEVIEAAEAAVVAALETSPMDAVHRRDALLVRIALLDARKPPVDLLQAVTR